MPFELHFPSQRVYRVQLPCYWGQQTALELELLEVILGRALSSPFLLYPLLWGEMSRQWGRLLGFKAKGIAACTSREVNLFID